jgi:hypothetical protein
MFLFFFGMATANNKFRGSLLARLTAKNSDSTAYIGFETRLWLVADKLRDNMDVAEYWHVVLDLIFINASPA